MINQIINKPMPLSFRQKPMEMEVDPCSHNGVSTLNHLSTAKNSRSSTKSSLDEQLITPSLLWYSFYGDTGQQVSYSTSLRYCAIDDNSCYQTVTENQAINGWDPSCVFRNHLIASVWTALVQEWTNNYKSWMSRCNTLTIDLISFLLKIFGWKMTCFCFD